MRRDIRFSGFGGQGIIRSGYIVGKAASLFDGRHATMTQSFGPEARGSACSSQLIISDEMILYPYLVRAHILVAMSQEACDKFLPELLDDGQLLIDADLVKTPEVDRPGIRTCSIPATRIAESLGNKIVANIAMLGFLSAVTDVVSPKAIKEALPGSIPDRALDLNLKAFDQGHAYGIQGPVEAKRQSETAVSAVD
jgi:2-oxoglutarate ferredoxin oxidoreductase subunit gamma